MAKGKYTYRCWFKLDGSKFCTDCDKGVAIFKDGFWVGEDCEITFADGAAFWIPPSALLHIEKVYEDV